MSEPYELLVLRCPGDHAALWEQPEFMAVVLAGLDDNGVVANMLGFRPRPLLALLSTELLGLERLTVTEARHPRIDAEGAVELFVKVAARTRHELETVFAVDRALAEVLAAGGIGSGALRLGKRAGAVAEDAISALSLHGDLKALRQFPTALEARLAALPESLGVALLGSVAEVLGRARGLLNPRRATDLAAFEAALAHFHVSAEEMAPPLWPVVAPARVEPVVVPPVIEWRDASFPRDHAEIEAWAQELERRETSMQEMRFEHEIAPRLSRILSDEAVVALKARLHPYFDERLRALDEVELSVG